MPVLTDHDQEVRAREIENALASVRMEGLEPSAEAKALFEHYVDGDLTAEDLDSAFARHLESKHGPVRLPGN